MTRAPLVVIAVGNPSRGDDALGPRFVERVEAALAEEIAAGAIEVLTDFQLQLEHALDLEGRQRAVFVDASVEAEPPFRFARVTPRPAATAFTHAMSPEAVLEVCRGVIGSSPEAWLLAIRGDRFELGEELSPAAAENLESAVNFFIDAVRRESSSR